MTNPTKLVRGVRAATRTTLLAALLAAGAVAWAGGVVVVLDGAFPTPTAGVVFTVGFTIHSLHTGEAMPGRAPRIHAVHAATGEAIEVAAVPAGLPGHYAATLTLPSAGEWRWEIRPYGADDPGYPATVMAPLWVHPADHAKGAY